MKTQNKVDNFQLVTITVFSLNSKYYFGDLPNLRSGVRINKIVSYFNNAFAKDINNVALLPFVLQQQAFVTLVKGKEEIFSNLELSLLNPIQGQQLFNFNEGYLNLDNVQIDFQKSYFSFSKTVSSTPVPPFSFCIGVYYS